VGELLSPILETRKPYVYVGKIILHKGGKRVVLESSGVPILDSRGEFLGYRGLDRDITERHRASEALYREKEKYRTLVEESPLGVAIIGKTALTNTLIPNLSKYSATRWQTSPPARIGSPRPIPTRSIAGRSWPPGSRT
jgi:PAS domain-containing protein